jgi:hypothetical protein
MTGLFTYVCSSHVMASVVGRNLFSTLFLTFKRCKQPVGLYTVSSKIGRRFESVYQAAVLQELKKPLELDEQKRKKLKKDEVSTLGYFIICALDFYFYSVRDRRQIPSPYFSCMFLDNSYGNRRRFIFLHTF